MTNPEDTATIERDLRAVDAVLSGAAPAHEDPLARELQELALALKADTPVPDRTFARNWGSGRSRLSGEAGVLHRAFGFRE